MRPFIYSRIVKVKMGSGETPNCFVCKALPHSIYHQSNVIAEIYAIQSL